jgi:hypothetical protein
MRFFLALIAVLPVAAAAPACSSSPPNKCVAYVVPAGFDATTPTVSFKNDIVPIFSGPPGAGPTSHGACAFSSCHGVTTGSNAAALYLGGDAARAYSSLVGAKSDRYPSMVRVAAGDAANSYLMHKLDGDSCTLPSCGGDCANTMPSDETIANADLIPVEQRDVIRRWILQGAQNN